MNRKNLFKSVLVLLFSFILLSCNKTLPPGEYDSAEVGKVKKVIPGTIISKRPVNLRRNMSNITKKTSNSFEDNGYSQSRGVEYVIRLNSGGIISVVQAEDLKLKTKQKNSCNLWKKHTCCCR